MTALQLQYRSLVEQQRANLAREHQAKNELLETSRSNKAREEETNRHNLVTEDQNKWQNAKDATASVLNLTGAAKNIMNTGESGTKAISNIFGVVGDVLGGVVKGVLPLTQTNLWTA